MTTHSSTSEPRTSNTIGIVEIVSVSIDVDRILRSVHDPSAGGVDVFVGTTRDHSQGKLVRALEYEAYEPMAIREMRTIAESAASQWPVCRVSIVHRVGRVPIGEASVVVAVSAVHRSEAFDACRYCIDTLKRTVPIWKKEIFADGEVWVGLEGQEPHRSTSK